MEQAQERSSEVPSILSLSDCGTGGPSLLSLSSCD
jgi:hypothetical protein